ncbi:MAG: zinc metallopeptidase [Anaerolineae bacterium]
MFYFDPLYLVFALPALLLAFYAQFKVQSTYGKYSQKSNWRGISGLEAARYLLSSAGLNYIKVEGTSGQLTDHYDPRSGTLRLSPQVAHSQSVAALGIVAHEVGHAMQDAQAYAPLRWRTGLVPAVNIGSWLGPILFLIGFLMRAPSLAWVGVLFFAGSAVFALITLPVELNASGRALQMLQTAGLVMGGQEIEGVKRVLNAAALTYVAALAQALSTLLYYVFLLTGFSRDE